MSTSTRRRVRPTPKTSKKPNVEDARRLMCVAHCLILLNSARHQSFQSRFVELDSILALAWDQADKFVNRTFAKRSSKRKARK
jgi:hypothetical protein